MLNWDYFCEKDKKINICCYHSSILKLQSEGYPCKVIDIPVQVEADITEDKQNASSLYSSCKKPRWWLFYMASSFRLGFWPLGPLYWLTQAILYTLDLCNIWLHKYKTLEVMLSQLILSTKQSNNHKDRCINKGSIARNHFALNMLSILWIRCIKEVHKNCIT